jgi:hypothetical protein
MIEPGGSKAGPGLRYLIGQALRQASLCAREDQCPDHVFRCRLCGYSTGNEIDDCPQCHGGWKALDVSHGPNCPKNRFDEGMDSQHGALVRRGFRLLSLKQVGVMLTLADLTEEEFRVMELIESERQKLAAEKQ